jgi:hypothetical protein
MKSLLEGPHDPYLPRMPAIRELEVQKVASSVALNRKELSYLRDRMEYEAVVDNANDRLVLNLHAFILKGPEKEVKRETESETKTDEIRGASYRSIESLHAIPASWWNYFKADVVSRLGAFGRWWLTRWPVEVRVVATVASLTVGPTTINQTTNRTTNVTREYRTCRHIPIPKDARGYDHHLRFLSFDEDNPPRPPRPMPYCPVCHSPPDHPVHEEQC